MEPHTSASEPIEHVLTDEAQERLYTWAAWVVPFIVCGLVLGLLVRTFGSLTFDRPLMLIAAAVVLCLSQLAACHVLSMLKRANARRSPLLQHATTTLMVLQNAEDKGTSHQALVNLLADEIAKVLEPCSTECAVYDVRGNGYAVTKQKKLLPPAHQLVAWVTRQPEGEPILLHKATELPAAASSLLDRGLQVIVPLGTPAWIALGSPESQSEYSRSQLRYLEYVSRRATRILRRAVLKETHKQRREELSVLYWVSHAVNFKTDVDSLLELVYTQLRRVMPLPCFYIALVDQEHEELAYAFYVEDDERLHPDHTWSTSVGLTGVLLVSNDTIRTNNYAETCRQHGLELDEPTTKTAWMGTTLSAGNRTVGVMVVSAASPEAQFTDTQESLFTTVGAYTAAILERHGLNERLQSRARQLATLNEIGNLLASSLDLDEVLDLVVENAAELLNSEAGSLLLLDEDTGDLVFRISSGPAGARLVGMRIPAGKGIAGAAFSENHPVISQQTHDDRRWYPGFDEQAEFVTESVIAVPLNARGRTIGVLEVVNRHGGQSFTEEDSELLLSFCAQAAIAIENARLFTTTDQELQARLQELTTLQRIDRQLNATLDYDTVMQQTLEWALNITAASIGIVAAVQEDEDGRRGLRFLAHQGYDDAEMLKYHDDELWPLDRGLIGHTVTLGETTLVTSTATDGHEDELEPGMAAQLTVPIEREARVIGAIVLESAEVKSFSDEHVAFLERLADHAAIAIDNARLFEQVQNANAAKTEFISFVSHELKQPMTSIKGYSDLLIKGVGGGLNELQNQFVTVVRNNVARMDRIVQDLLDVSRIEAGRLKLEMGSVAPDEVVTEATQAFEQAIEKNGQTLQIDVEEGLPAVTGDRGRLIQVLTNLISNANKYTPEGGTITVSADQVTEDKSRCVRWQVKDTGIGMSEDEIQQLFTKYFRSQRPVVRSVQGTGLGLVITRSIVEMHGGHMDVASEVDKGSVFSFTVPVTSAG